MNYQQERLCAKLSKIIVSAEEVTRLEELLYTAEETNLLTVKLSGVDDLIVITRLVKLACNTDISIEPYKL